MSSLVLQGFNKQLGEMVNDINGSFPNDVDIKSATNSLLLLKKANPRKIIEVWKTNISDHYYEQIIKGDFEYFINKDYENDVNSVENKSEVMNAIDRLRMPIKHMTDSDKEVMMKYILNLSKLSILYYKN
jgi:hypothetical protein